MTTTLRIPRTSSVWPRAGEWREVTIWGRKHARVGCPCGAPCLVLREDVERDGTITGDAHCDACAGAFTGARLMEWVG